MARGFLAGFVVGTALSMCAAALISVVAGPPVPPEIVTNPPSAGQAPSQARDAAPTPRLIEGDPRQPSASELDAPEPADGPAVADDLTRPAARPEPVRATPGVTEPAPLTGAGGVAVTGATPVRPRSQLSLPGAPDSDSQTTIATEPPRPNSTGISMPEGLAAGDAALPTPPDEGAEGPIAPAVDSSVTGLTGSAAPRAPGQPDQPGVSAETAPRPDTSPPRLSLDPASPDAPGSIMAEPDARSADTARPIAGPEAPAPASPEEDDDIQVDLTAGGDTSSAAPNDRLAQAEDSSERRGPMIGTPATSLLDRDGGAGTSDGDVSPGPEIAEDRPAILRHGESFSNTEDLPIMSIILIDNGQSLEGGSIGLPALDSFPYPLSIAVDTSLPDAAERAASHRAAGFEVMALVDLPPNLTPSDIEVALPRLLDRVPEAVAVLEGPGTGLQGSPEMAAQVGAILQETGHGIVWRPSGLDTAQRIVARDGVASQTLFRDFDSEGQTPMVIRRFFDQAAFRAVQEGSVIMVGRLRPDTITALVIWGLQDRVRRVAVAPVSAALLAAQGGG